MGAHNQAYTFASRATDAARSVTDRPDESDTRLAEAAVVAQRTGETGPDVAYFAPTDVTMYRMTSALERGDSALAVELAGSVQPAHIASPERRAKHWLDTGRALRGIAYRLGLPA